MMAASLEDDFKCFMPDDENEEVKNTRDALERVLRTIYRKRGFVGMTVFVLGVLTIGSTLGTAKVLTPKGTWLYRRQVRLSRQAVVGLMRRMTS